MTAIAVRREPLTYEPTGPHSFFRDLLASKLRGDTGATERLARHEVEMAVERRAMQARDAAIFDQAVAEVDGEVRTNPSTRSGSGGEFTPPLWMIDRFASASRAGRPLGDLLDPLPLPDGTAQINIPRMSTGSATGVQVDGGAVANQDIVTADSKSQVVTIAGHADVSQQVFDLTPNGFDSVAYIDLNRAYNRSLEAQLLSGTGATNGQLQGLDNVTGKNDVSGSTGTTLTLLFPLLGQAAAAVGNNRLLPPEVWLMAPRRWFWIASSLDQSNRPISSPGNNAPVVTGLATEGGVRPVGPLISLPVYMDGAIPALTSADTIYAVRPSDMFLFESTPRVLVASNPLAGTLGMRISLHRYVAFISDRYPQGIARVTSVPAPASF
jgi:HK97 family phage major capsid protein